MNLSASNVRFYEIRLGSYSTGKALFMTNDDEIDPTSLHHGKEISEEEAKQMIASGLVGVMATAGTFENVSNYQHQISELSRKLSSLEKQLNG